MMTAARPTRASPTCLSSIMSYLPARLFRKAIPEARQDETSNTPSADEILAELNRRDEDKVGGDNQHSTGTSARRSTLCQNIAEHTVSKSHIGLGGSMKIILHKALPSKENCVACSKQVRPAKVVVAPCGHKYCSRCLRKMAKMALQDTAMFPLRCCSQEILPNQVTSVMNAPARRLYNCRVAEHSLPPADRWYCPHTTCGRWISPRHVKENSQLQKCPHCRARICSSCRDLAHGHRDCVKDPDLGQILEVARRHRWQRCPNCLILVFKTGGCNHMKCRCAAEFCYVCGRQYPGGCSCRSSTETDGDRIGGEGDLDVATIVTAMEIAEREEVEVVRNGVTETTAASIAPAPMQPQASSSMERPRVRPVRQPRVKVPARVGMPTRPAVTRHTRPSSSLLPNEAVVQVNRSARPMRRVNLELYTAQEVPARLIGPAMPIMPVRAVDEDHVSSTV